MLFLLQGQGIEFSIWDHFESRPCLSWAECTYFVPIVDLMDGFRGCQLEN
jgi:hypothetical protein